MLYNSRSTVCNILLISNDCELSKFLNGYLNNSNVRLKCSIVINYKLAESFLETIVPDLLIVDLDDAIISSRELINKIADNIKLSNIPKILLTNNDDIELRVHSFEMGMDDCMKKPVIIHELIARIKNIFKKYKKFVGEKVIYVKNIIMNLVTRTLLMDDKKIKVSTKEFDILKLLIENKNRVFSRKEILIAIWKNSQYINHRTVDVHINRLRAALGENLKMRSYIKTVRNAGYQIDLGDDEEDHDRYGMGWGYDYSFLNIDDINYSYC